MQTGRYEYQDDGFVMEGYLVRPDDAGAVLPCILLCHDWSGLTEPTMQTAERFAALGYVVLALDVYGKGRRGDVHGDNSALMIPLMEDRAVLRRRLLAGVSAAAGIDGVDAERMAVIGYCFGGMCALDLVRAGAQGVCAAITFHGGLLPPNLGPQPPIAASILMLHGWSDPIVPPETVAAVADELTAASADWEMRMYGHAMHAFTFAEAHSPEMGILYNEDSASRSWSAAEAFLARHLK
jgi:dienelactone hydrolase